MSHPLSFVVNCKLEAYEVYVGRPSKWGNPFVIGPHGTRQEVIAKYREWLLQQPELIAALPELRGKVLGCHCWPAECHAEVLARLANMDQGDPYNNNNNNIIDHLTPYQPPS